MAATLYDILGVAKNATSAEIKRAYRTRAQVLHPDHGGGADEFAELKNAFDVLSDPARRSRYDSTGDAQEKDIDNLEGDARQLIMLTLDQCLQQSTAHNQDVEKFDLLGMCTMIIETRLAAEEQKVQVMRKTIGKLRKIISRTRRKKKKGVNVIGLLLDAKIAHGEGEIAKAQQLITAMQRAIEILNDHAYAFDVSAPDHSMFVTVKHSPFFKITP